MKNTCNRMSIVVRHIINVKVITDLRSHEKLNNPKPRVNPAAEMQTICAMK